MGDLLMRVGPESALAVRCLGQATWHQTRVLALVREARAPEKQASSLDARRGLVLQALEHLVQAQRLVKQAQQASQSSLEARLLGQHLERLEALATSIESEAWESYVATEERRPWNS